MKFKWDKKYLYWGVTAFCVIIACVLANFLISNFGVVSDFLGGIANALMPVVFGFVFAYLLTPVMNFFEKRCFRRFFSFIYTKHDERKRKKHSDYVPPNRTLKIKRVSRVLGVFCSVLMGLLLIVGLIWAVIPQLIITIKSISGIDYIKIMNDWAARLLEDYPDVYKVVEEFITNLSTNLQNLVETYIMPELSNIVSNVSVGIVTTVSTVINLLIGVIICIYFLNSKELFAAQGKKVLYGLLDVSSANLIIRNLRFVHKKFGGFLTGKIIDSLIIGMIFFVVLTICDMPYVVLMSVVLGVTNIIPYFGPFIGAIPCGLLVLFTDPIKCLYFVIIVLVVQQFDGNILGPKILGDNTGLSSFWVIFAILVGQHVFGFVGLIIGIPVFAVIYSLFKNYIARRLRKKSLPQDSNAYRELGYYHPDTGDAVSLDTIYKEEQRELEAINAAKQQKESFVRKRIRQIKENRGDKK